MVFFTEGIPVEIKNADIAAGKAALLLYPDNALVFVAWFHAVAGNVKPEIGFPRNIVTDFFPLIIVAVEKIAGSCGYTVLIELQAAGNDGNDFGRVPVIFVRADEQ